MLTLIIIRFGVIWVALLNIMLNVIALIVNSIALQKNIPYSILKKVNDCLPAIFLSVIMVLCVYLVNYISIDLLYIRFFVKIIIGVFVYF
jgi:hypothetical protein